MTKLLKALATPLGKVKGLGAGKNGVGHWWAQRVSALFLLPLGFWLGLNLICLSNASFDVLHDWMRSGITASLMILTVATLLYHSYLGLQVVIEDYVHCQAVKTTSLILVTFITILLGVLGITAILTLMTH